MADRSLIDGMPSAFERVKGLSLERVESEIDRLIVTPHAARGFDLLVRTGLNECFCHATEYGKETEIAILPELSQDRKSTRLNSSHKVQSRMPSSA